eukprot:19672-Rhodomonas_salina.1
MRSGPLPESWSTTPSLPQPLPGTPLFPPTQQPLPPPLLPTTGATRAIHHQPPQYQLPHPATGPPQPARA